MNMKLLGKIKTEIAKASRDPRFVHHGWFLKYHLEIVEKIALELCEVYEQANRELVLALVWLHDYDKICHPKKISKEGKRELLEMGFDKKFVAKIVKYIDLLDKSMEINLGGVRIPIEVKIVSSADGASHLIGPFFSLYWWENYSKPINLLLVSDVRKAKKDWQRKIVLPEVKKEFETRFKFFLEQRGFFPDKFL